MKKIFFSLSLAALAFAGCKERTDLINYRPASESLHIDSDYVVTDIPAAQLKNLLIEDFTGVQCQNCPKAQQRAEKIADSFPGRVVINGYHVTDFSKPYIESKYNFNTVDGENIYKLIVLVDGKDPGSLPAGDLNRKIFAGKTSPFINYTEWINRGIPELSQPTPVNISFLKKDYNESTREADVEILVTFTQDVADSSFISVAIKESGMIDIQAQPSGDPDTNYVHKHVLRAMIAPYNGLFLGSNIEVGRTFVVSFTRPLKSDWVADNCTIAAFVHHRGKSDIEVQQVVETNVK